MAAPTITMPVMAGTVFGLSAKELAEKYGLGEDTAEGIVKEFGETQPFKTSTTTYKGRGNVLGYRTGGLPTTTETVFGGASLPVMPKTETEEAAPKLKQFTGTVGGVPITDMGEMGFGMKDYNIAVEAGYDPESIESWVKENRDKLFNIGPEAQKTLGITDYTQTTPGYFDYSARGGPGFGMEDVNYLRSQGAREEDIRKLAQQAPYVGEQAYKLYGGSMLATPENVAKVQAPASYPTYQASKPTTVSAPSFDYGSYGQAGFGGEDLSVAKARGYSDEQIASLAASAPGGLVGPKVREYLSARGY